MRMNRDPPPRVSRARAFFCLLIFLILDHKKRRFGRKKNKKKRINKSASSLFFLSIARIESEINVPITQERDR